ncbi:hypothetical protein ADIAL_1979 [Alkalibacterium sp. AK22]|uniref:flagellar basal body-associated FliL family protein n=1 Tax=Alkalibacterium sp. AK22 TaxID=1229520 RepID=UPI00045039C6|nr:flagellar basal body-associated FliL family protein [Alkalibacterium sp. AK22]EXJ22393.1 hypothetical protein ADIAL_1979 [Alkalibacterium sp. AK22]
MAQTNDREKKKKVGKILTFILLGGVLIVLGIGLGVTVFDTDSNADADTNLWDRFSFNAEAEAAETAIPLEEFLVNVKGDSSRGHAIVRMEITVTSFDDQAKDVIAEDIAKVRDAVIHVVSGHSTQTILEEAEGEFIIKDEIRDRINRSLEEDLIEEVFVTNILIQR